jgi:hypothetical protein
LRLLEQFHQAGAAIELLLRGLVQFGAELGEGFQFAISGQIQRSEPAIFFIALVWALPPTRLTLMPTLMAGRTPAKNRVGLQINLAVGDADDVGRDVRRDFAFLGFDDRQGGQLPPPFSSLSLTARSSSRLCR